MLISHICLFSSVPLPDQPLTALVSKAIDSVHTLTYGIHDIIKTQCPGAIQDKSILQDCVTGPKLLPFLKNVTFDGRSGQIKFDKQGDGIGQYAFKQYHYHPSLGGVYVDVALWDQDQQQLFIQDDVIDWSVFQMGQRDISQNETFNTGKSPPVSICSLPCGPKQFSIRLDLPCCWECHSCRDNEILGPNSSMCVACPSNFWPNELSGITCDSIPLTYLTVVDAIGIGLLILNCFGLLSGICVVILFVKHRNEKLIKASSRELSSIILGGILLAYVTVFIYLAKPDNWSCIGRHVGFHLSVSLIYCPLLVKTNRVHRIFSAGKKGVKKIAFVASKWQLLFSFILLATQVSYILIH